MPKFLPNIIISTDDVINTTRHLAEIRIGGHLLIVLPRHAGVLRVGIDHLVGPGGGPRWCHIYGFLFRCYPRNDLYRITQKSKKIPYEIHMIHHLLVV